MRRVALVCGLVATVALQGCAGVGIQTERQKVAAFCVTASASLRVLAVANGEGKLTESARKAARAAVAIVAPVCDAESPPSMTDAQRAAFVGAISVLQAEAVRAQQETQP